MKTLRVILAIIVVIVLIGLVVWRFFPDVRRRGREAYRKAGGWTEAARRDDPVGFIAYAEAKLSQDLLAMQEVRAQLIASQEKVVAEQERNKQLLNAATELAETFRATYRTALATDGFPVRVSGREYTRDQVVEQVRLILLQKGNYETILKDLGAAAVAAKAKAEQLLTQTNNTSASLAALPAKKEIARANQLTGKTEELLNQVNELIGQNELVLTGSPVRTVEELVTPATPATPQPGPTDEAVKAFLEGGE